MWKEEIKKKDKIKRQPHEMTQEERDLAGEERYKKHYAEVKRLLDEGGDDMYKAFDYAVRHLTGVKGGFLGDFYDQLLTYSILSDNMEDFILSLIG